MEIKIVAQNTTDPQLWATFQSQINQFDWGGAKFIAKKMLGNMAPNERIAIALDSKTVIGVGALVDQDIAQIPQTPFISTIYVTKKYRKNQLGTAIVSKLEHTAQQLGYKDVFIISSLDNFYEKMHFSKIDDIIDFMNRPMKLYQKSLR